MHFNEYTKDPLFEILSSYSNCHITFFLFSNNLDHLTETDTAGNTIFNLNNDDANQNLYTKFRNFFKTINDRYSLFCYMFLHIDYFEENYNNFMKKYHYNKFRYFQQMVLAQHPIQFKLFPSNNYRNVIELYFDRIFLT